MSKPDTTVEKVNDYRWQCRRGMLELDILLNNFVDSLNLGQQVNQAGDNTQSLTAKSLSSQQRKNFELLLSYPDQALFDLLLGNAVSSDPGIAAIVKQIQSTSSN